MKKEDRVWEKMSFTNSFVPSVVGIILFVPVYFVTSILIGETYGSLVALALVLWGIKIYLRRKGIK